MVISFHRKRFSPRVVLRPFWIPARKNKEMACPLVKNLGRRNEAGVHAIKPLDHAFSAGCATISWQYAGFSPTDQEMAPGNGVGIPWIFGRQSRSVPRIEIGALQAADGMCGHRYVCSTPLGVLHRNCAALQAFFRNVFHDIDYLSKQAVWWSMHGLIRVDHPSMILNPPRPYHLILSTLSHKSNHTRRFRFILQHDLF